MKTLNTSLTFFLNLAKVHTTISRRFDGALNGLSLTEFIVLFHLSNAHEEKMRRVDLAEKVGLTASGVTRLLLPMEKIGLVQKEVNERDARSSYVALASGGKEKLAEAIDRAEIFCDDIVEHANIGEEIGRASNVLRALGGTVR